MIQSSSSETLLKERSTLSQRAVLEDTLAACCLYFKSPERNFCASCPIGIALAAFGFLNPLLAAFIHVASEMTFILNSARLLPAVDRRAQGTPATLPAPAE